MASSWSALRDSFAESAKDTVKYQNEAAPTLFLLYEARLINVNRFQRTGKQTGLISAEQLWIKFVGFSHRLQKCFRHSFHSWLSCWLGSEVLSDFGQIFEAVIGERPKGFLTAESAHIFSQRLIDGINTSELYAKVLFRKFKAGDRYLPGKEIEFIKLIEEPNPPSALTKLACDSDKTLLWNIHPSLASQKEYLIFRNDNSIRQFGHCLPEFDTEKESYEMTNDEFDDEPPIPEDDIDA